MKLELTNSNYCATIVRIKTTNKLDGCDNLIGTNIFGYNIILNKDTDVDELKILFTTETEISPKYLSDNNLYSSSELNENPLIKGYIGKNGRVRAIKLRGHSSNAMLMPISSLRLSKKDENSLKEGDSFNIINGIELCKKYEIPVKGTESSNKVKGVKKKYERIDGKNFPEHFDTEQFLKNEFKYNPLDEVIVTQKLHGTSVRFGYVETKIKPTLIDRILRRQRTEYDYLAGSRRVIKDLKSDREFAHYYEVEGGLDIYNKSLQSIKDCLPKDVMIFAEIIGYNGSSPIQRGYTYEIQEGKFEIYIYRIASINRDGMTFDWSWDSIKEFCSNNGLKFVPELWRGQIKDFCVDRYLDVNYSEQFLYSTTKVVPLPEGTVDEGVCIRKEGIKPYVTKVKSPLFYEFETKLLDEGIEVVS